MSCTIVLLLVLGFSVGWCNPIDLGVGSQGIPPDFTVNKAEERIHFRGEGKNYFKVEVLRCGVC